MLDALRVRTREQVQIGRATDDAMALIQLFIQGWRRRRRGIQPSCWERLGTVRESREDRRGSAQEDNVKFRNPFASVDHWIQ